MKTISIEVYEAEELSEFAKQRAHYDWCLETDYDFHQDNKKTLDAFVQIFPLKIDSYEYGGQGAHIVFSMEEGHDDEIAKLSGWRLSTYLWNNYQRQLFKGKYYNKHKHASEGLIKYWHRNSNILLERNCVLTGYFLDEYILGPVYDFLAKPDEHTTFRDLMRDCLNMWLKTCEADREDFFSLDHFLEEAKEGEWMYKEDGSKV